MFHLAHMVHMIHIVHGFSKSIDFTSKLCQQVHHFSRNIIKVPTNEREKQQQIRKLQKVAKKWPDTPLQTMEKTE